MITGIARLVLPTHHLAGPFSGDKIFWHTEKLDQLREGKVPAPINIEMDVTDVCNLHCLYCTNADYNRRHRVTLREDVVVQVLDDLIRLGAKAITFTGGGEPTCHPRLAQIMIEAHARGLDVALITNGTLLHKLDIPDHVLMRCKWLRVSLDAHDRESYKDSKGKDCFNQVIENIITLAAIKVRWRQMTGMNWVNIGVGHLTMPSNYEYIPEVARVVAGTGADYLQFRPVTFMPDDSRANEYYSTKNDIMPYIERAKQFEKPGFRVFASMPKYDDIGTWQRGYRWCYGVYFACVVGATGDVWICCHMRGYENFSLGNVRERRLFDIWNDVALRNEVYGRIADFSDCMPLCRFHGTNKRLDSLNWEPQDVNFL